MASPILVDGHNLAMRCIMASVKDDYAAGGLFNGGVYGALKMLQTVVVQPDLFAGRIYAVFDHGVPAFREQLLPGYKANRADKKKPVPDAAFESALSQIDGLQDLLEPLGVTCVGYEGYEADDVIAAMVRRLKSRGEDPVVVSSDADLLQTVDMGARVWVLGKHHSIAAGNFEDEVGVPRRFYLLYKVLCGDSSDNIKGAKGIGPVKAKHLLVELEGQLDHYLTVNGWADCPLNHLQALLTLLKERSESWATKAVQESDRLINELKGVDLSVSFPYEDLLDDDLDAEVEFNQMDFLRVCVRWKLSNITGDPTGFITPFQKALRRAQLKEDALVTYHLT